MGGEVKVEASRHFPLARSLTLLSLRLLSFGAPTFSLSPRPLIPDFYQVRWEYLQAHRLRRVVGGCGVCGLGQRGRQK